MAVAGGCLMVAGGRNSARWYLSAGWCTSSSIPRSKLRGAGFGCLARGGDCGGGGGGGDGDLLQSSAGGIVLGRTGDGFHTTGTMAGTVDGADDCGLAGRGLVLCTAHHQQGPGGGHPVVVGGALATTTCTLAGSGAQ
eukprot:scaffold50556_cov72-Attheya_sp.AAC.2